MKKNMTAVGVIVLLVVAVVEIVAFKFYDPSNVAVIVAAPILGFFTFMRFKNGSQPIKFKLHNFTHHNAVNQ